MRITAGKFKGRRMKAPTGKEVRPTTEKVREAIFNILLHEIPRANVLDLFSGAGTLGIEALSRGAESALFVDKSSSSNRTLSENLSELELDCPTLELDWTIAIQRLAAERKKFKIIFADPPYRKFSPTLIAEKVAEHALLAPGGILIIEADAKDSADAPLRLLKRRTFGQTQLLFYTNQDQAQT